MIKSAKIRNFESWKEADIEFHPGINIIVGESDEGKSGLIRALRLNMLNKPEGFAYRSDFLEDNKDITSVEIEYNSKDKIIRQRNLSGINEYRINNGEPLVALKTDVPTEVSDISKISDINLQRQHPLEQYFLLTERPGAVAKEFNKVSGLKIMDKALKEINQRIRSVKDIWKIYDQDLSDKEKELKSKKRVIEAAEESENLESLQFEINKIKEVKRELKLLIDNILIKKKKIAEYKYIINAQKNLKSLKSLKSKIQEISDDKETLNTVINRIKILSLKIKATTDIKKALNALKSLKNLRDQKSEIKEKISVLSDLISKIETAQNKLDKAEKEYQEVETLFHDTYINEKCPVCGRIGKDK